MEFILRVLELMKPKHYPISSRIVPDIEVLKTSRKCTWKISSNPVEEVVIIH